MKSKTPIFIILLISALAYVLIPQPRVGSDSVESHSVDEEVVSAQGDTAHESTQPEEVPDTEASVVENSKTMPLGTANSMAIPIIISDDLASEEEFGYDPNVQLEPEFLSDEDQHFVDVYAVNNDLTYEEKVEFHHFVANVKRIDDEIEEDYEYKQNREEEELEKIEAETKSL